MSTIGILMIWALGMTTALLVVRAYTNARKLVAELRKDFSSVESRLASIEETSERIRGDAEIQLRALTNIAIEARTILERARAVTQLSSTMEGEQLTRLLEAKMEAAAPVTKPVAEDEFVNTPPEDKTATVRSLFS